MRHLSGDKGFSISKSIFGLVASSHGVMKVFGVFVLLFVFLAACKQERVVNDEPLSPRQLRSARLGSGNDWEITKTATLLNVDSKTDLHDIEPLEAFNALKKREVLERFSQLVQEISQKAAESGLPPNYLTNHICPIASKIEDYCELCFLVGNEEEFWKGIETLQRFFLLFQNADGDESWVLMLRLKEGHCRLLRIAVTEWDLRESAVEWLDQEKRIALMRHPFVWDSLVVTANDLVPEVGEGSSQALAEYYASRKELTLKEVENNHRYFFSPESGPAYGPSFSPDKALLEAVGSLENEERHLLSKAVYPVPYFVSANQEYLISIGTTLAVVRIKDGNELANKYEEVEQAIKDEVLAIVDVDLEFKKTDIENFGKGIAMWYEFGSYSGEVEVFIPSSDNKKSKTGTIKHD